MTSFELTAERLARAMNRRQFVQRASATVFGLAIGVAAGASRPESAFGDGPCPWNERGCGCGPIYTPGGRRYCNSYNAAYCNGSKCAGGCRYNYDGWPSTGCWCTKSCCYGGGKYTGYYKCCDCFCAGVGKYCGCRSFVMTCPSSRALEIPLIGDTDMNDLLASAAGEEPIRPACC